MSDVDAMTKTAEERACWNYRVFRHKEPDGSWWLAIHEAHYAKRGDREPSSWSTEPVGPGGETVEELCGDMAFMHVALARPVLDFATGKIVGPPPYPKFDEELIAELILQEAPNA